MVERVAAAVPEELTDGLLFMDRSLSPNPLPISLESIDNIAHAHHGPIKVLAGAVRRAEPAREEAPAEAWPMEVGPAQKWLAVDDPELRELMEKFPTLGPLDRRVDDAASNADGRALEP